MKDSECQGNNPEPKDGSMVQCLLCAMEDIIRRRQRSTQQEARLQLKLAHYLLDLKQDYNNYKMCYETALSCASSPIYNHDSKSPRPTSPPISAGSFCQYENVGRRDICPITTIVHLEKLLHKTPMSDYCTRLDRIDQVQYELFDFLSGAKLDSESNMCEPPKHMDLTKENGIDFIVDVVDRDTGKTPETMLFEIDPDPVTGELFLSPDDITYDSKKGLLNVVYDCRESGAGYMRCHFSLSKEHCKSVKTTNFVRAYDENNRFIERCSVTVQGLHFSILCDSEKTSDQDIGDRRMKLVEYRQSTVFWANQQREKYNQILHARGGSRRRLLARAAGVKEGC